MSDSMFRWVAEQDREQKVLVLPLRIADCVRAYPFHKMNYIEDKLELQLVLTLEAPCGTI